MKARPPLSDAERNARMDIARAIELTAPLVWMLMSFADEEGFRGAVILQAHGMVTGMDRAWRLGLNPGGHVKAWVLPGPPLPGYAERLLTREEAHLAIGEEP